MISSGLSRATVPDLSGRGSCAALCQNHARYFNWRQAVRWGSNKRREVAGKLERWSRQLRFSAELMERCGETLDEAPEFRREFYGGREISDAQIAGFFCESAFLIPHQIKAAVDRYIKYRKLEGLNSLATVLQTLYFRPPSHDTQKVPNSEYEITSSQTVISAPCLVRLECFRRHALCGLEQPHSHAAFHELGHLCNEHSGCRGRYDFGR